MRLALLLLVLLGCGDSRVYLAIPEGPSAGTLVLVRQSPLSLELLGDPPKVERSSVTGDLELLLLSYDASFESLGLSPGPLAPEALCRPCVLQKPERVYFSRDGSPFQETDERPAWLLEALVPDAAQRCGGCAVQLRSELVPGDFTAGQFDFVLLPWTEDSALLVGGRSGSLARLNLDGRIEPLCVPSTELTRTRAVLSGGRNELWIGDSTGVLSSLQLDELQTDRPCSEALIARSSPLGLGIKRLAGPADQRTPQIYALVTDGESANGLYLFDGATWSSRGEFEDYGGEPSLVYASDGWVYAVGGSNELIRARGTESEHVRLPAEFGEREITVVGDLPGFGIVIGDRMEGLLVSDGSDGLEPLGLLPIADRGADRFRGLLALDGGILLGTSRGAVRFFDRESGFCAPQGGLFGREEVWNMVLFPGPVIFTGNDSLYRAFPASDCPR